MFPATPGRTKSPSLPRFEVCHDHSSAVPPRPQRPPPWVVAADPPPSGARSRRLVARRCAVAPWPDLVDRSRTRWRRAPLTFCSVAPCSCSNVTRPGRRTERASSPLLEWTFPDDEHRDHRCRPHRSPGLRPRRGHQRGDGHHPRRWRRPRWVGGEDEDPGRGPRSGFDRDGR